MTSRIRSFLLPVFVTALLLSACGARQAGANPDGSVNVNVTLTDFGIESSVKRFTPGVKYRFLVTNEGQIAHEFMLMPVAMDNMGMSDLSNMSMEEKDAMALMVIPQDELPAGARAERDYTFTSAPRGKIEMVCTLPGHYEAGMHVPVDFE